MLAEEELQGEEQIFRVGTYMDLTQAIQKHGEWKLKFRSAIANKETLDARTIGRDDCCDLGKWLHGEGKTKFAKLPSHAACVGKHAAFHVEAGKVAQIINAKKFDEATAMLAAGPYVEASSAVGGAIMKLKLDAKL